METKDYLEKVLQDQRLAEDSPELKSIRKHREDVESILRAEFEESAPIIRYGGSKAKGTMIRESYDLDIICYFASGDTKAGESLKDIYDNVAAALEGSYFVERKSSALRLRGKTQQEYKVDFHVDVVPGRFTDDSKTDSYLYISTGEKSRLKTNLQIHLDHVVDSGVIPAIKLFKLWRSRNSLTVKNFVLELLVIKLLSGHKKDLLESQLKRVWEEFRDKSGSLSVEDPANPSGNDLSQLLNNSRSELQYHAQKTLANIEQYGWTHVFGDVEAKAHGNVEVLKSAAAGVTQGTRPWRDGINYT